MFTSATTTQVINAFNEGRIYGVYSGHGLQTSWADGPPLSQSQVRSLTNGYKLLLVFSFACLTGQFNYPSECFGETWLRESNKGSVGFWGSSTITYWDEDDILEKRLFSSIYDGIKASFGAMTVEAKVKFIEYYTLGYSLTKYYLEAYNVLGDPTLNYAHGVSGTISQNTTWGGNIIVTGNVTVNSGVTLTINPGTNVYFASGTSLIVNGTLSTVGNSSNRITFTRIGSSGTWGGIQFNSGSSGSISYANISYATQGVKFNNVGSSSITVSNSTIENNSTCGIYLYNSSPQIYDNQIQNNGYYGIWCNSYSSPTVKGNFITGHTTYGFRAEYYSSAGFYQPTSGPPGRGYNTITGNSSVGIIASYYSNLFLGLSSMGGYNNIYGNGSYELSAYYGCTINAENCYWGTTDPGSEIYQYQSTVDYQPYLTTPAQPQSNSVLPLIAQAKTTISSSSSTNADLSKAFNLFITGKYDEAIQVYNGILENELNTKIGIYALIGLSNCYRVTGKKGLLNVIKSQVYSKTVENNEIFTVALELENRILMEENNFNQVIINLGKIVENHSSTPESKKHALFNLGYIYLNLLNDRNRAEEFFTILEKEFPDDQLVLDSKLFLNKTQIQNGSRNFVKEGSVNQDETSIPQSFELLGNYPNPFNPATKIQYKIGSRQFVTLKVYDVLGREVAALVNEEKPTGKYEVKFNGKGLTSGIYFYRLTAISNISKFVQTNKMILLK